MPIEGGMPQRRTWDGDCGARRLGARRPPDRFHRALLHAARACSLSLIDDHGAPRDRSPRTSGEACYSADGTHSISLAGTTSGADQALQRGMGRKHLALRRHA